MKTIIQSQEFGGERPLYKQNNLQLQDVTIHVGESSIKECRQVGAERCQFEGKYVFWECRNVRVKDSLFVPSARSSVWYSEDIEYHNCRIDAPKMFRRAANIRLTDCVLSDAQETLWDCRDVVLENVEIRNADYLFMHTENIRIANYKQDGNYSFQYAKNVEIHNAVINSKDSFWDSEDCTIYDSEINGEYLGWYAKRLRLVRCHITGEQPLCYAEDLIMEDCTMGEDCNLGFEYSSVRATIKGTIHSVKNPTTGVISAESIGEIILDENILPPADCQIQTRS